MAAAVTYGIPVAASNPNLYPSYQLSFTYGGNNYSLSLVLTNCTASDSTDLDAAVMAMVDALTTGYTDVSLYQLAITPTELS